MKNLLCSMVLIFHVIGLSAQDVNVKKGIIYLDDVPSYKMVGDCGMFKKLNYAFLSMTDDTLFTMKDCERAFDDPRNAPIFWHELDVKKVNEKVILEKYSTFVTDKSVAKFIFSLQPNFLKDGVVDMDLLTQFISKHDYSSQVKADTLAKLEFEYIQTKAVLATKWNRDMYQPLIINPVPSDSYSLIGFHNYTVYEILQNKVLLGVIVVEDNSTPEKITSSYYFLKRLQTPFTYEGSVHYFGMVAFVEDSGFAFLENLYTKERPEYKAPISSTDVLYDLTKHLVDLGDL
jgi:hypothetical protein